MKEKKLELEKQKLKETLEIVNDVLAIKKQELDNLYNGFIGDFEELWRASENKKNYIKNLETSLEKPYFARIEFVAEEDGKESTIYIGKNGIIKDNDVIVVDWRAPISSLYYDAEVGECSYNAPDGIITGNMNLKRQYEIEHGNLLNYFDVDLVSNDELLQKYLNLNNDARLKSIVSTIQKEQNEVIRKNILDNLIIQGVAGSGKTTVALHRIAYLVYNYKDSIIQNQYLVLGSNSVFIKYIKSVLPDLDVTSVAQSTFELFTKNYIKEDIKISSSEKKANANIVGKISNDIDKFKCSVKYKNMLDQFLNLFFSSLTTNDLKIGNFVILKSEIIKEVFEGLDNYSTKGIDDKVQRAINILTRLIEKQNESIIYRYNNYSYELFKNAKTEEEKNNLRNKFAKEEEQIKKNCKSLLKKYFAKTKTTSTKLYKAFIDTIFNFDIYKYEHLEKLKKDTLYSIKKRIYDFEDLAALMYLKQAIYTNKEISNIRHVVIDEAQDFGEFNFLVLKKVMPNATFSIFGDLAQSIYDYRSIDNWTQVNSIMFENNGEIVKLKKSYRTTSEIMSVADIVAESIGLEKSELVVRHGNPVKFTSISDETKIPNYVLNRINEYKEKGYKTIAIISKTNLLSLYMNDNLTNLGLMIPNVTINDDLLDERFRICTISNQLAKGLEFDAVIINNASEKNYNSNSSLDMKLLYVAITRALHNIDIIYSGKLTKPLDNFLTKNNLSNI